jgi:hypothetical protein
MSRRAVHRASNSTAITRLTHSVVVGVEQVYVLPLRQAIGQYDRQYVYHPSLSRNNNTCFEPFMGVLISRDKTTRLEQQENNMHISAIHGHFYRELQGLWQWFLPTGSS